MKILHIINSLNKGGAEETYIVYVNFIKKYNTKIDITILTLIDNGFYEFELKIRYKSSFIKDQSKRKLSDLIKKYISYVN